MDCSHLPTDCIGAYKVHFTTTDTWWRFCCSDQAIDMCTGSNVLQLTMQYALLARVCSVRSVELLCCSQIADRELGFVHQLPLNNWPTDKFQAAIASDPGTERNCVRWISFHKSKFGSHTFCRTGEYLKVWLWDIWRLASMPTSPCKKTSFCPVDFAFWEL